MRRVIVGVTLVIAVAAAVVGWRRCHESHVAADVRTTSNQEGSAKRESLGSTEKPSSPPIKQVRRLEPEERRRMGEQLAAALERRSRSATPSRSTAGQGEAPELLMQLEDAGPELQQALSAAIPVLAECYRGRTGDHNLTAMMTMTSDPDLGTVIDTERMTDADGQPLDATLDTCMRDAIDALALPPLAKAGKLPLQYTFKFD